MSRVRILLPEPRVGSQVAQARSCNLRNASSILARYSTRHARLEVDGRLLSDTTGFDSSVPHDLPDREETSEKRPPCARSSRSGRNRRKADRFFPIGKYAFARGRAPSFLNLDEWFDSTRRHKCHRAQARPDPPKVSERVQLSPVVLTGSVHGWCCRVPFKRSLEFDSRRPYAPSSSSAIQIVFHVLQLIPVEYVALCELTLVAAPFDLGR